jgi:predicted phage replisome organizer
MASTVKWVKLYTSILNDDELLEIQMMPDGPTIWMLWIKLLVLAGTLNTGGVLMLKGGMPYTEKLLAEKFHIPRNMVHTGLSVLQRYKLLDEVNGCLAIGNWKRYQAEERLEKIREKDKERKRKSREEQKRIQAAEAHELPDPEPDTGSEWYAPGEAQEIQREQSELLDLAEEIRLAENDRDRRKLIELYADYGGEVLRYALNEAADHKAISFAYVTKVCKDYGKEKPKAKDDPSNEYYRDERIEDWN